MVFAMALFAGRDTINKLLGSSMAVSQILLFVGFFTLPVNKTDPLLTKTFVSAINSLSCLNIKLEILVFITLSFIDVPIPFSLETAPKETILTVPIIGAQEFKNKATIININFRTSISFLH